MSNELVRIKRSIRRHKTWNVINKYKKIAKYNFLPEFLQKEPHRMAKHNPFNCGSSRCVMCGNPRKVWNELTIQERKFFQEELEDYDYVN